MSLTDIESFVTWSKQLQHDAAKAGDVRLSKICLQLHIAALDLRIYAKEVMIEKSN